jgi:hypothetical protein
MVIVSIVVPHPQHPPHPNKYNILYPVAAHSWLEM